jgi:hypothetical protein
MDATSLVGMVADGSLAWTVAQSVATNRAVLSEDFKARVEVV